jgi:regulator of replication initiation timing
MSVYRELAGELQATQSQLDGLRQENQHLKQENQRLRLEIKKLVQSVQRLDTTINNCDQTFSSPPTEIARKKGENRNASPAQEHWYTHQPAPRYPVQQKTAHQEEEINGWFVIAALVMIVFTFSGIGFMVARPLLNQSGQN